MKALIVINAYVKNKSQLYQAERIASELGNLGTDVSIEKNFDLARIVDGKVLSTEYSFCIYLDKDRVAARLLERGGLRLFNSAEAMETCDDKMLTAISLANAGINLPDCVYAPLCYHAESDINESFLRSTAERLGLPLVAKINYGSLGSGVTLINSLDELFAYEKKNLVLPHFYQKYIDCGGSADRNGSEDVRVIVFGGKYLCAMKRKNLSDFRSNIELGGKGEPFSPDAELIALCERVAGLLKLDYCGVDILRDKTGKYYVCEVNSNAFFTAMESVCNVNVARAYAQYALNAAKTARK